MARKKAAPVLEEKSTEPKKEAVADKPSNLVGMQLGDYRLTELLASGGMARIYKGEDVKLGRQAAVKVLTQELLDTDDTLTERFQREAKAVGALDHDNIVPIYQYGEANSVYFLAMKLIQGKDLADELNALSRQGKLMEPKRLIHLLGQIAAALDHAHAEGIIHRDVKPSNILIDRNDKAYLTDFGLVLRDKVDKTMGTAFGTPRYISPEQALASERAVAQSDVYSLAVIVYEALTGHMVFKADTAMQIALSHISEPPPPPRTINPNVPRSVEREILKALEKDPKKRHKTATEFINAVKDGFGDDLEKTHAVPDEIVRSATPVLSAAPDMEKMLADKRAAQERVDAMAVEIARRRSRRSPLPLLLIVLLIAGIAAFIALNGGQQTSAGTQDDDATEEEAPEVSVEDNTDEQVMTFSGDGEPVSLLYTFDAFALRNDSTATLNVRNLVLTSPDGNVRQIGSRLVVGGQMQPGECLVIRLNGRTVVVPETWNCGATYQSVLAADQIFWRTGNADSFEVRFAEQVVAACDTISRGRDGACEVNWPAADE
jgi:serine/threonine-protein kinase